VATGSFTDAASLTWSKVVVGAVAEAAIMNGYPDGSFGPKRPISRAESVVTLNRALPTPITPGETTTTGSSSDSGDDNAYGIAVRLTGIYIDDTLIDGFDQNTWLYSYETNKETVKVEGTKRDTTYKVTYRVRDVNTDAIIRDSAASSVDAPVNSKVEITVSKSGASRTYTVTITKPGVSPGDLPWEQIAEIEAEVRSTVTPAFTQTSVYLTIKPDFHGKILGITVRGVAAKIYSDDGSKEVWRALVPNEALTRADLINNPGWVQVEDDRTPEGKEWVKVDRAWADPIEEVYALDRTQPITPDIHVTELRITVNVLSGGELRGIALSGGRTAARENATTWTGSIITLTNTGSNVSFSEILAGIAAADIQPDYSEPIPSSGLFISRIQAGYSSFSGASGHYVSVSVFPAEVSNADDIVITDNTTNEELGSLKKGTILPEFYEPNKFNTNLFPPYDDPNGRSGTVTVVVTAKDGSSDTKSILWSATETY
jgi:hypothetical protein